MCKTCDDTDLVWDDVEKVYKTCRACAAETFAENFDCSYQGALHDETLRIYTALVLASGPTATLSETPGPSRDIRHRLMFEAAGDAITLRQIVQRLNQKRKETPRQDD